MLQNYINAEMLQAGFSVVALLGLVLALMHIRTKLLRWGKPFGGE